MKTTIEIADELFEHIQRVARKEKTTFRSLTQEGLRLVLKAKAGSLRHSWDKIRDEIYGGRGA